MIAVTNTEDANAVLIVSRWYATCSHYARKAKQDWSIDSLGFQGLWNKRCR